MAKGIFLNIPSSGHINPSLSLIRELVSRGEDIVYVLTENHRTIVEATGARFVPYPEIADLYRLNELASGGNIPNNAHTLVKIGEELLPFIFDLMDTEKPDYLIHDSLAGWGLMTARKYPIPTIATFSTFMIHPRTPPPLSITDLIKTFGQLIAEVGAYRQTRKRIQKQFGITSIGLMEAVMAKAPLNIVYTSREFQPQGQLFDEHTKFVGAMVSSRPKSDTFPYDFLDHDPLIYISLGTINNTNLEFYQQCFESFQNFEGHFVMSIGQQITIDSLGEIPKNFLVMNSVPQLDVLKKTDVFITHGGLNSVHESLLEGVPMIVMPQQVEQAIVARQVEKFGAGIRAQQSDSLAFVSYLTKIIHNKKQYQKSASKLGQSLRDAGGATQAADEILTYIQKL